MAKSSQETDCAEGEKNMFLSRFLAALIAVGLMGLGGVARAEDGVEPPAEGQEEEAPPADAGFNLGEFYIKNFRPSEGAKTKLTFTLHATTAGDNAEEFERLLKNREHRIRDQVIVAARLAEPAEFRDPQLDLFRRRIRVRLRRATPELLIKEIYLSEFRYFVE